jgi:hypothetical protein
MAVGVRFPNCPGYPFLKSVVKFKRDGPDRPAFFQQASLDDRLKLTDDLI